ncbi:hypothetical protein SAMN04515695_4514 [Pseudovibrio sp. Tun.PSC04-5.I4]|nr:hypothetical protein SAMN04515695_4514 [Pseudovibrio sp. Tun.PSC04-5.I4]
MQGLISDFALCCWIFSRFFQKAWRFLKPNNEFAYGRVDGLLLPTILYLNGRVSKHPFGVVAKFEVANDRD